MSAKPRLTLGLPVYNGQKHLAESLESILAQTYRDFELIISDNASTDRTADICRQFAARDPRIRYDRLERNIGAAGNFNRLIEMGSGELFKWVAHDDLYDPDYLRACVKLLDDHPEAVLAFARRRFITYEEGTILPREFVPVEDASPRQSFDRITYPDLLRLNGCHNPVMVFGVIRSHVIRQTSGLRPWIAGDIACVVNWRLLGEFVEEPRELFFQRLHGQTPDWQARLTRRGESMWFDPNNASRKLTPGLTLLKEYWSMIGRAPLPWHRKLRFYRGVAWYTVQKFSSLLGLRLIHKLRYERSANRLKPPESIHTPLASPEPTSSSRT